LSDVCGVKAFAHAIPSRRAIAKLGEAPESASGMNVAEPAEHIVSLCESDGSADRASSTQAAAACHIVERDSVERTRILN
jgi:hypothetical protein